MKPGFKLALLATLAGALSAAPAAAAPLEWKAGPAFRSPQLPSALSLPPSVALAFQGAPLPAAFLPSDPAAERSTLSSAGGTLLQLALPPALPLPFPLPRNGEGNDIAEIFSPGNRLGPETRFMLAFGRSAPWPGSLQTHTLPEPASLSLLLLCLGVFSLRLGRARR